MRRGTPFSKLNPATMPGPGDLWGSPEDDESQGEARCEECDEYFTFDVADYMDCDEDGPSYCGPPEHCEDCAARLKEMDRIDAVATKHGWDKLALYALALKQMEEEGVLDSFAAYIEEQGAQVDAAEKEKA